MSAKILIVDDYEVNIDLMESILAVMKYDTISASNGQEALDILKHTEVDLILMDLNMPILDGYETCEIIKKDPKLKHTPIIFITSECETNCIVKCFNLGGNDYIVKPFNAQELLARVKTQLERNALLKEKIKNTKFETIGKLSSGIVHEINTPLTFIKGSFEMMKMDIDDLDDTNIKKDIISTYTAIQNGLEKISKFVDGMHELSQTNNELFEELDIKKTISTSLVLLYNNFKRGININIENKAFDLNFESDTELIISGQKQRLEQVWMIILKNAIDALNEKEQNEKTININFKTDNNNYIVTIEDNAGGIEEKKLKTLFEEPLSFSKSYCGLGVGLYIANKIIEEHNGKIEASNSNKGAILKVTLPM